MKKKIFKSRKFKKVVAIALTVATTTTLGNGGVYKSVSGVENASKPEQTVVKEKPKVVKELKDERTQKYERRHGNLSQPGIPDGRYGNHDRNGL